MTGCLTHPAAAQTADDRPAAKTDDQPSSVFSLNFALPLKKCWVSASNRSILNSFIVASDNQKELSESNELFVSYFDGGIALLNASDGVKQWESDLGGQIIAMPLIEDFEIYVITQPISNAQADNTADETTMEMETVLETTKKLDRHLTVRNLNKDTGVTRWQRKISVENTSENQYFYQSDSKIILFSDAGKITALNKFDGQTGWVTEIYSDPATMPFLTENQAIIHTLGNEIMFLSLSDGSVVKKINTPKNITAFYYDADGDKLVLGSRNGEVSLLSINQRIGNPPTNRRKPLWKFRSGAAISDITSTPRGFLISSFDNFIYLISKDKGNLIWKKRLSGRISAKPLVIENYTIVSDIAEPIASILDLNSGRLINRVTLPDENFFVSIPLIIGSKLVLTARQGIFAFSNAEIGCGGN